MKFIPHDYQKFATDFVLSHPYCGLILDMGLGKSVITLTALWDLLLDSFDGGCVLVVAPKRVAEDTWPREIGKWEHLKGLIGMPAPDTSRDISDWNAGRISMGLLHPASDGHGLNLQEGGSTVIWYGLTWSLELYQQLNARLWRQGQSAGAVVIHHIVAVGTHDEDVMRALERKDVGQAALIAAVKAQMEVSHERKD